MGINIIVKAHFFDLQSVFSQINFIFILINAKLKANVKILNNEKDIFNPIAICGY